MNEPEIRYTYMADEMGNYVIFKPDGDTIHPQRLCDYLNVLEARLFKMEEGMKEEAARAWYYHDKVNDTAWDMLPKESKQRYIDLVDNKYLEDRLEALAGESDDK